jgi:hypothetical protein
MIGDGRLAQGRIAPPKSKRRSVATNLARALAIREEISLRPSIVFVAPKQPKNRSN